MNTDQFVHAVSISDPVQAVQKLHEAATVFLNLLDYVAAHFPDKLAPDFVYDIEDQMRVTFQKHNVGAIND